MKLGVRGKLFVISVGIIATVSLISGVFLELTLRGWLVSRVEAQLKANAEAARVALERSDPGMTPAQVDSLADALGDAMGARITVIAEDGRLLGDSALDLAALAVVESHHDRPEVLDARADGLGSIERYSQTLRTRMIYVAVPYGAGGAGGVMRAALDLEEVDVTVGRLRLLLLFAGGLGLLFAILMSGLASHLSSRSLRRLVDTAKEMTATRSRKRLFVSSSDEVGRLAGSLSLLSDELERSVNDLGTERNRLQTVLQAMEEAVVALDDTLRITLVNGAAENLLGSASAVVGRPLIEVIRAPALADLVVSARSGKAAMAEFDFHGEEPRRLLAQVTPERVSKGVVVVITDVTRMRRLETIRRDFVANISHELRTPISVILANSETLLDGALIEVDPKRARRFLEAVQRNGRRLARLIDGLLDIGRLEADRYPITLEPVNVDDALERAIDSIEASALEKGLAVIEPPEYGWHVQADRHALDQVLLNLLENAVKYTPADGHITLRALKCDPSIRLEVEDDGFGIEPRHQARVFERFYRVDPGRSRDSGGTGLGLAIVKHLISAMKGTVGVGSAEPRGSVFWFELPAADEPSPATDSDDDSMPLASA